MYVCPRIQTRMPSLYHLCHHHFHVHYNTSAFCKLSLPSILEHATSEVIADDDDVDGEGDADVKCDGFHLQHPWDSMSLSSSNLMKPEIQSELQKKLSFCLAKSGRTSEG